MEKLEQIKSLVEKYASYEDFESDEDFNPFEVSGGNFDDAFSLGVSQGAGDLAREILSLIKE